MKTRKSKETLTRREFLAAGGGFAALLSANTSCGPGILGADLTKEPATIPDKAKSRVALVRTEDRETGVSECLKILDIYPCKGKNVLIKPNFNTADPTPGSTHNDTLRAILNHVRKMEANQITIGDRSGPQPTVEVLKEKNIHSLAGEFAADVINFDTLGESEYIKVNPPGSHWKDGFLVAKPIVEAECVLSTCCLKTHQFGGFFTMALKNSVGIVPRENHPFMRELHDSQHQRKMIAEINVAYKPALVILDGLEAFVDGGPMTGTKKAANVFLASTDPVAIDAVGVAVLKELGSNDDIMKIPTFAQEQISRAAELKLGAGSASEVMIVTQDKLSEAYADRLRKRLHS